MQISLDYDIEIIDDDREWVAFNDHLDRLKKLEQIDKIRQWEDSHDGETYED